MAYKNGPDNADHGLGAGTRSRGRRLDGDSEECAPQALIPLGEARRGRTVPAGISERSWDGFKAAPARFDPGERPCGHLAHGIPHPAPSARRQGAFRRTLPPEPLRIPIVSRSFTRPNR